MAGIARSATPISGRWVRTWGTVPVRDIQLHLDYWHAGRLAVERLHTNIEPLTEINEGLDAPAAGTIIRRLFQA